MEFKTLKFIFGWSCVRELFESFSVLFLVMGDVSELHLVPNCSGSVSRFRSRLQIHMRYTSKQKKHWVGLDGGSCFQLTVQQSPSVA
ncbi:Cytidylate kinase [Trichinella spiralis]|uniref:Cytidylate kinase n=1 Tax=Trichinella spiralis TaxID=6334 RepID=A0ABR3K563_TRISP